MVKHNTRRSGSCVLVGNQTVRMTGVEPACLTAPDPKSGTSANFATSAFIPVLPAGTHRGAKIGDLINIKPVFQRILKNRLIPTVLQKKTGPKPSLLVINSMVFSLVTPVIKVAIT